MGNGEANKAKFITLQDRKDVQGGVEGRNHVGYAKV